MGGGFSADAARVSSGRSQRLGRRPHVLRVVGTLSRACLSRCASRVVRAVPPDGQRDAWHRLPSGASFCRADPAKADLGVVRAKGGASALLGLELVGALWSASGYIGAFTRATNVIYETREGRPMWKLRPLQLLLTLEMVFLLAVLAISLVVTGGLARGVGDAIGVGGTVLTLWDRLKRPAMVVIVMAMFSVLYWATPNVKQPAFRWIQPRRHRRGARVGHRLGAFRAKVAKFGSYNRTYGSLGAIVAFLVWLWISNIALLFGAELNSELERQRELDAGERAERQLQQWARPHRRTHPRIRNRSATPKVGLPAPTGGLVDRLLTRVRVGGGGRSLRLPRPRSPRVI